MCVGSKFVKNGGIGHGRHQRPVSFFALFSVSDKKEKLMKRYFDNFIFFLKKKEEKG